METEKLNRLVSLTPGDLTLLEGRTGCVILEKLATGDDRLFRANALRETSMSIYIAQNALLILGMAFTGYWAYEAFDNATHQAG